MQEAQDAELSVILVNWNTRELLRDCLVALYQHAPRQRSMEIVLVEDGSMDGSAEMVAAQFPGVRLIRNPEKRGFTHANNQGLAAARGALLLCLNTDTQVHAGALDRLCDLAVSRSDIGICSAKLLNSDGTPQAHTRNYFLSLSSVLLTNWQLNRILPGLYRSTTGHQGEEPAAQPCADPDCPHRLVYTNFLMGACHLLRRDVYERIGPQDEAISIWCGDGDWCLRATQAGYRLAVLTCARITHHGGGSTKKNASMPADNRERVWGEYQACVDMFRKHHGAAGVLAVKLIFGIGSGARAAAWLLLSAARPARRHQARTAAGKYWSALRRLPHM